MGWSADDVPDVSDSRAIVTGANSGLGFATARILANRGASVVLACRDEDRATDAATTIEAEEPAGSTTVEVLDLGSLDSISRFADRLDGSIDLLINNAGVMAIPRRETADGFERQFGVNHLGHFALTGHLIDAIAPGGRIVTVSSGMHKRGTIDFDDPMGETEYDPWEHYAQSKLANLLFAYELDRRLGRADEPIESVGAHPGYAATQLQYRAPRMTSSRLRLLAMRIANKLIAQSAERGALPILYAATAPGVEGGGYYGPGGFMNLRGAPERQEVAPQARDRETAKRLWERSADLTGVTYDLPAPETSVAGRQP